MMLLLLVLCHIICLATFFEFQRMAWYHITNSQKQLIETLQTQRASIFLCTFMMYNGHATPERGPRHLSVWDKEAATRDTRITLRSAICDRGAMTTPDFLYGCGWGMVPCLLDIVVFSYEGHLMRIHF